MPRIRAREDQQRRLQELIQRRTDIERQIVNGTHNLEQAYKSANNEMMAAIKGKQQDLADAVEDEDDESKAGEDKLQRRLSEADRPTISKNDFENA